MTSRLVFCIALTLICTACSSVPERFAFWRDDTAIAGSGQKPHLHEVPDQPEFVTSREEINALRVNLEKDRALAWEAAKTTYPDAMEY